MARLTPEELRAARIRSGNLGGRPRKPTGEEARAAALERLVPKSVKVLEDKLESGGPDAWRPALRVLEHAWGRPPDKVESEPVLEDGDLDFAKMPMAQLMALARRRRRERA